MSNKVPFLFNKDVSPNSGCEFLVSINKNGQLILIEREIRLGFQSPRPNPENRGEFQSPRIVDNIDSSFIKEMAVRTGKELPVNAKTVNTRTVNAKTTNARTMKANVKPIIINTNMQNVYYEAILTDIYDDNE
jgi:hypothetical protein